MLILKNNLEQSDGLSVPTFTHDPSFICFVGWAALLCFEGKLPRENRKEETTLYLNRDPQEFRSHRLSRNSAISLKNDSDTPLLNVTLFSKEAQKEVFYFAELPPHQCLQIQCVQAHTFYLFYTPAWSQTTHRRTLNIFSPANPQLPVPHNFCSELKPHWQD